MDYFYNVLIYFLKLEKVDYIYLQWIDKKNGYNFKITLDFSIGNNL